VGTEDLFWNYCLLSSDGLYLMRFPQTFITMYQTIHCPNPDHITNRQQCEHLKILYQKNITTEALVEMSHCEN
jgi:hypothetical protein